MSSEQRRVLIVEDDPDTAELLTQQLEDEDLEIDVARNGQEAILKTGQQPPDVIVMDIMMPHLDGFETSRFLKAKFRDNFVPILVLSAKDDAQSKAKGARFGCEEYLTKPYSRKQLAASLSDLLEIGALERQITQRVPPPPEPDEEGNVDQRALDAIAEIEQEKADAREPLIAARLRIAERQVTEGQTAQHPARGGVTDATDLHWHHRRRHRPRTQRGQLLPVHGR